eukprot:gene13592-28020_t
MATARVDARLSVHRITGLRSDECGGALFQIQTWDLSDARQEASKLDIALWEYPDGADREEPKDVGVTSVDMADLTSQPRQSWALRLPCKGAGWARVLTVDVALWIAGAETDARRETAAAGTCDATWGEVVASAAPVRPPRPLTAPADVLSSLTAEGEAEHGRLLLAQEEDQRRQQASIEEAVRAKREGVAQRTNAKDQRGSADDKLEEAGEEKGRVSAKREGKVQRKSDFPAEADDVLDLMDSLRHLFGFAAPAIQGMLRAEGLITKGDIANAESEEDLPATMSTGQRKRLFDHIKDESLQREQLHSSNRAAGPLPLKAEKRMLEQTAVAVPVPRLLQRVLLP